MFRVWIQWATPWAMGPPIHSFFLLARSIDRQHTTTGISFPPCCCLNSHIPQQTYLSTAIQCLIMPLPSTPSTSSTHTRITHTHLTFKPTDPIEFTFASNSQPKGIVREEGKEGRRRGKTRKKTCACTVRLCLHFAFFVYSFELFLGRHGRMG